jgi:hypothetical protein
LDKVLFTETEDRKDQAEDAAQHVG